MSTHSTSGRGVMMLSTERSPNRKVFSTIACSTASTTPDSAPCSTSARMSCSVTPAAAAVPSPMARSTRLVVAVSSRTIGPPTRDNTPMGRATSAATRSGLDNAIFLGTSSPMMSERKVMAVTTMANATDVAYGASHVTRVNCSASTSAMPTPPKAPASTPTSVMPTCTVERKVLGLAARSSAARAPASPVSSTRCSSRVRLAVITANSDMENTPLITSKMRMTTTSVAISPSIP